MAYADDGTTTAPQVSPSSAALRWAKFEGVGNICMTWSRASDTGKDIPMRCLRLQMATANYGGDSLEYPTRRYSTAWQEYYYSQRRIHHRYNDRNEHIYESFSYNYKKWESFHSRINLAAASTNTKTPPPFFRSKTIPNTSTSMICSRQRPCRKQRPVVSFCATTSSQPSTLSNPILRATLIGALATAAAQLVGCPVDVVSKLAANSMGAKLKLAGQLVRSNGIGALYKGLPFHLMKRTPTKALTVCLFEVFRSYRPPTTKAGHIKTALLSGMLALAATYPATVLYYGSRKGIPFGAVMERIRKTSGGVLYAGFIPAVTAVAPSVTIDYSIYRGTREHLVPPANANANGNNNSNSNGLAFPLGTIMVAAAVSNMVAGGFAEPLKMIARRSAVSALKGGNCTRKVALELLKGGPGEFYRGFRSRSLRYALTAVVSKTTVQRLREIDTAGAYRVAAL